MAPTRIYVKPLLSLLKETDIPVHALSHITGGGLLENLPGSCPRHCRPHRRRKLETSGGLRLATDPGNVDEHEMHRVLNCGIGMVLVVPADRADQARAHLQAQGETVYRIGDIVARGENDEAVRLENLNE